MKRLLSTFCLILLVFGSLAAQGNGPGFEKYMQRFKAERVAFLTDKLDFTVEEAQNFWPLYNQYQDKRGELLKSKHMENHGRGNREEISSEELEVMVDNRVEQELKLAELKLNFHKEVKKIIPIEKVVRLYRAEGEFMNFMLKKLEDQRSERRRNGPGDE